MGEMTVTEIKARMFDLNQKADELKKQFDRSIQPLREEFQKLARELPLAEDAEADLEVAEVVGEGDAGVEKK
jgi:hypothetical protein